MDISRYWLDFRDFWRRYARNKAAVVGLGIVAVLGIIGGFASFIAPHGAVDIVGTPFQPPLSPGFLAGTDDVGRDLVSRLIYGTRTSLTVGITAAALATVIGILIGGTAGYFGGKIDEILMRVTDLFLIIPTFVLALVITAIYGRTILIIILVIGIVDWTAAARLTRGLILSLKETNFVLASVALGEKRSKILWFEILPNAFSPILANATLQVATAILIEAGLSFLGMGDPSVPSLGKMLYESTGLYAVAWWLPVFPGLILSLLIMGINLAGDGFNDALKMRRAY